MPGMLQRLLQAFLDGMILMALADDEYWLARQHHADPEAARLLPWLAEAPHAGVASEPGADWDFESEAVIAEIEAMYASESEDVALIA